MALATVFSRAQNGLAADLVTVEVHLAPGIPGLNIVGLPEAAVREAKDRVRAAIQNCGYQFPNRRITCNLAPADLPKEGGRFDLAIALGILAGADQIPIDRLRDLEVLGELSLSGEVRPVRGALPATLRAAHAGRQMLLPEENLTEAALVKDAQLSSATHLAEVCAALHSGPLPLVTHDQTSAANVHAVADLCEVRGQHQARRVLEIAASGAHSMLMVGPPGAGKSMLACRLPGILPPLDEQSALQVAAIASVSHGGFDVARWGQRPFRAPHHTASGVALVGGGSLPRPGEITLAHQGVLFLDELPEFDRRVLEVLREPLENGRITVSRAARQADFPARFQLIAAMNPCPCGYLGDSAGRCRCTPDQIQRYRSRISGPLLDRIDLQIFVPRVDQSALTPNGHEPTESSTTVGQRVLRSRLIQMGRQGKPNAELSVSDIDEHCALDASTQTMLRGAMTRLGLSARAYHRVLRVARSIADLAESEHIARAQVAEALRYRELDRAPQA